MFGVKHNECVGFDSRWSVKKVYYEGNTQTPLYVSKDGATTPAENKEVEVQTDPPEALKNVDVDVDRLAGFLTKMYPRVKRELDDVINSRAFDNYSLQGEYNDTSTELLQAIEVIPQEKSMEAANVAKLSSFSWNSTAKTIAVSLSYSHQSWCYDPGLVLIYTFDRDDKLPSLPSKKINCDSCVSQVQFHPSMAAILAGITHSSGIFLWNIQNNEDETVLIKISRTDDLSCLSWMTLDYVTMDIVFLVTAGLDGTITMWRFNGSYSCANVYNKYRVKAPLMAKIKPKSSKNQGSVDSGVGVSCFDFSKHLPDMFVVGTEGGLVIQCSTSKPTKLKGGTEIDPLYDPVYQYYQPHESRVSSVQFSKVKKDVFLTSGSDRQFRIYVIGQEDPARVIFDNNYLNILYWVPNEKHLVYGYGGNGKIEVFNVITGKRLKIADDEEEERKSSNLNATCFLNPYRSNMVAVGLNKGVLELWSVPWSTFSKMNY